MDSPLGFGSCGLVMKAFKNERAYAIKTAIKHENTHIDETQKRLFLHEANLLKQIDHHRIPRCIETFTFQNGEYLVQEYVHGAPLSNIMLRGYQFSESEIIGLLTQLLEILCFLHKQHIVHRDLRLGNLILTEGQLHLIDFGLARRYQHPSDLLFLPDPISRNASPTYLALRRKISPRSDIFGAGLVAIDLLSNCYSGDCSVDVEDYPISAKFQEYIKKLLTKRHGFVTALEALQCLNDIRGKSDM